MELFFVVFMIFVLVFILTRKQSEADKAAYLAQQLLKKHGPISPAYICPHCQIKGGVRAIVVKRKKGISGAKATGAVLTMGISILATGLSRKENMTHATCSNCGSIWDF